MKNSIPQHQQVIDVMNANGGFDTLGFLYHKTNAVPEG